MSQATYPYRYDIVGSFLRPVTLKKARLAFAEGELSASELRAIEDQEIAKLVDKQIAMGQQVVMDGEFRRSWWHLDFIEGLLGVESFVASSGIQFHGKKTRTNNAWIADKVAWNPEHPFLADFAYLQSITPKEAVAKQTIPALGITFLLGALLNEKYNQNPTYDTIDELLADLVVTYQEAIQAFYDAGCRYLQLDDTSWNLFCDPKFEGRYAGDLNELTAKVSQAIAQSIEKKPADLVIAFHTCHGNFNSTYASQGDYTPITDSLFKVPVDGFFLEFDSDRNGGFEPLAAIEDAVVVLGLITTKTGQLEDKETIIQRIHEATAYIPLERLCLSTQCGFASTEEGNILSEEEQWAKIRLVNEIAREVWHVD
ncbi:5-methyltetrahydropteroyltriglutamate--homocysteine S-methyltransferase [Candidatus Enterococcus willemsii]|uniref:Cobalamin-independent methionine synthase MetE C-terminal/archaeal domain-containing protein n=1 Tax=Candidatus Enterococcus willemsii TaxID=1857215 RepID=A0ABQ6Z2F3_9ENTE|nr:5-methyltetrahydropteroyltriglutamate--homocysteine S-methyltransferase [Enterococcus sp. CU12B]KAF1305828.1 hypothetical protein BAU17_12045 [Enterococcus sp. CU12B]